jgi:hypothetical protein
LVAEVDACFEEFLDSDAAHAVCKLPMVSTLPGTVPDAIRRKNRIVSDVVVATECPRIRREIKAASLNPFGKGTRKLAKRWPRSNSEVWHNKISMPGPGGGISAEVEVRSWRWIGGRDGLILNPEEAAAVRNQTKSGHLAVPA